MAHAPTTVARVQRAYEPSLSAHRKLPSRLIVSIPIGGDVAMQRENYSRVPKHVPNSANLRSSEPISGAKIWLRKANIEASRETRNEGVRGSSPRVGSGKAR